MEFQSRILEILKNLSQQHDIYLQWGPSHIGLSGNETADILAKEGASLPFTPQDTLTYLETYSRGKILDQHSWRSPPSHAWYDRKFPGGALTITGSRRMQTTISRFASGHLKCLTFKQGQKYFPICPKCNTAGASPDHLLNCLGLDKTDTFSNPLLVFNFIMTFGFLVLV